MESLTANDATREAEQLMQLELFGLGRLLACIAQLQPTAKQKLFRGLLLAAANRPSLVAVIEQTGELIMLASVPLLAGFAGCSERSLQRYSRKIEAEGIVTQDRTVNTAAEWSFNLRDVLPAESVPWFIKIVETGDPDCVCRPDSHPDSGVTTTAVTPTELSCHPDSHPDSGVTAGHLSPENTGPKMSYDLGSYVRPDITSEPKKPRLNKSDLKLLQDTYAAAKGSGAKTLGSVLATRERSTIDLGLRTFAAIDFADVQRIAGFEVDGERWGLNRRQTTLSTYFADAVKARTADESEFRTFAETFCMCARRKPEAPQPPEPDERAGYVRTCWQNRSWRPISIAGVDRKAAAELLGDDEVTA